MKFGSVTISRCKKATAGVDKVALVAKSLGTTVDFLLNRQEMPKSRTEKIYETIGKLSEKELEQLEIYLELLGGDRNAK